MGAEDGKASSRFWLTALVALVIGLTLGVMCFAAGRGSLVPVYRGKVLTSWLRTYAPSSPSGRQSREWGEADDAVRHIGTNCIPVLLRMVCQRDSKMNVFLVA